MRRCAGERQIRQLVPKLGTKGHMDAMKLFEQSLEGVSQLCSSLQDSWFAEPEECSHHQTQVEAGRMDDEALHDVAMAP